MNTQTFTTSEQTRISKDMRGNWKGETKVIKAGKAYVISTHKTYSGALISSAQPVTDMGGGSYSFAMFGGDASITLETSKPSRITEQAVKDQHFKALASLDEKIEGGEIEKPFQIEKGQILFTHGPFESKRRAVVEVLPQNKFRTVLLDGSEFRIDDFVKDYDKKFGIGVYYVKGDSITAEQVDDLCITATVNEAKKREDQISAETLAKAARAAKIETGAAVLSEIPTGVTHVIIGELLNDESDPQTDYFGTSTEKVIYLAFSNHGRDLFAEMRKGADNSEHTAFLGAGKGQFIAGYAHSEDCNLFGRDYYKGASNSPFHLSEFEKTFYTESEAKEYAATLEPKTYKTDTGETVMIGDVKELNTEHREKYSGGRGYYLGEYCMRGGWKVKKTNVPSLETLQIAIAEGRYFIPTERADQKVEKIEAAEVVAGSCQLIDYSEKAVAVIGDTRPIKDQLKALGGRFNPRLTCGAGWILSKTKEQALRNLLNL